MAGQFVSMKSVTTADTDREAAVVKWLSSACGARVGRGGGGGGRVLGGGVLSVDSQSRLNWIEIGYILLPSHDMTEDC